MGYYEGKTVLVTGGHGFLGQHLVSKLLKLNAKVLAPTHLDIDLTDAHSVGTMCSAIEQVDLLFHLAASVGGIAYNKLNPATLFHDNLAMGFNLIDQLSQGWQVGRSVFVGSVCSYPLNVPVPTIEEHLGTGEPEPTNGAYGWSKLAVGKMLQAYHQQYGIKAAWPIMANMYGRGDHFEENRSHVIPALIKRFVDAKEQGLSEVVVWGTGSASRDFLYVTDAVEALLLCGEKIDNPEPINIASGRQTTIGYIAREIADLVGYEGQIVYDRDKPEGQPRRCWNINKAKRLLAWMPVIGIEEGLDYTVEWYQRKALGGV